MTYALAALIWLAGLIVGAALTMVGLWLAGAFDHWVYSNRKLMSDRPRRREDSLRSFR